ncbi:MAG: hypothetical protein KA444_02890 [Bacteroidia bacterium]|nr:hypothetical protein [Bacteroidia bacterium]
MNAKDKKNILGFTTFFFGIFVLLLTESCRNESNTPEYKTVPVNDMTSDSYIKGFDLTTLVSLEDTICGMSLKDGVTDTLNVGSEIYGFCSSGCKNKFISLTTNP